MRKLITGLALGLAVFAGADTASAQFSRNRIVNSGNGAYNRVAALNRGYGHPGVSRNVIRNSGNGAYNRITASNRSGRFGFPGGFGGPGFAPGGGGCYGPAGGGFGPGYVPRGGFGGLRGLVPDVNVNVIANSGNGVGNRVTAGNRSFGRGGLNFNIITNSGNGTGNFIGARNRRR